VAAKQTIEISASDLELIKNALEETAQVFETMAGGIMVSHQEELNRRLALVVQAQKILADKS